MVFPLLKMALANTQEAHSGWILISRNKMKFENLWKNYLNMTKGLLVFVLVVEINGLSTFKNSPGWIEIPKIPRFQKIMPHLKTL